MGLITPFSLIEEAKSSSESFLNSFRGCKGLVLIFEIKMLETLESFEVSEV